MSRPSSSVPNQCAALGGWSREGKSILPGSCGAIQGANMAKMTKTTTRTMPAEASTLLRPRVFAAVQVVEKTMSDQCYLKAGRSAMRGLASLAASPQDQTFPDIWEPTLQAAVSRRRWDTARFVMLEIPKYPQS